MNTLLKYQTKHIRAKADCTLSRGRILRGPRFEIRYNDRPDTGIPLVRTKTGPSSHGLRPAGGGIQAHWGYHTRMTSPGEEVDIEQTIARRLCVEENLAELVSGGAFNITEERDGIHFLELWYPPTQYGGPVHSLFNSIEKIETLIDGWYIPGLPAGSQLRIRAMDFFQACSPRNFCWLDDKADPPAPSGVGNGNHLFRLLRASPVPKAVAMKSAQQANVMRELWKKTFPDLSFPGDNPLSA